MRLALPNIIQIKYPQSLLCTGLKSPGGSSALGSRSDGQRPTLTAAFGGSVRRAPRRPSSPRRAGGRSSTRRSRSRETSTISGRMGWIRAISTRRGAICRSWCNKKGAALRRSHRDLVTMGFPARRSLFMSIIARARVAWRQRQGGRISGL